LKNAKLAEIKSQSFNGKIIIPLDKEWLKYFKSKPIFQVVLNKNRIMLIGPRIAPDPITDKPTSTKMEASDIE